MGLLSLCFQLSYSINQQSSLSLLVQRHTVKQERPDWASPAWVSTAGENHPTRQTDAAVDSRAPVSDLQQRLANTHLCLSSQPAVLFSVQAFPNTCHSPQACEQPLPSPCPDDLDTHLTGRQCPQLANSKGIEPADYTPSHPSHPPTSYNGDVNSSGLLWMSHPKPGLL